MNNKTLRKHSKIVDDFLYYIYRYIDTGIDINEVCDKLGISRFHFQRVFKEITGKSPYEFIKSIRLQKSASLLLTNRNTTISTIAQMCGYSSQSSFIKAFKTKFNTTPKLWREGGFKKLAKANLPELKSFDGLNPKIMKTKPIQAYYIRHKGYTKEVRYIWQRLQSWLYHQDIKEYRYIGLYHDNPAIIPLREFSYIAAVEIVSRESVDETLSKFTIPSTVCASFEIAGKYGDILKLIEWAHNNWLPSSGFDATTLPSFTIFKKNHFIEDSKFLATYYLPIK